MVAIRIELEGMDRVQRMLGSAAKQVRFATAVALTRTVRKGSERLQKEMQREFDRPTPWIGTKGTYSSGAKPATLEARFGVKDRQALYVKEYFSAGRGRRGQKPYERVLRSMGVLPADYRAVPGAGLKLDGRGNPNRNQLREILGALKSHVPVAKGKGKRMKLVGYFVVPPGHGSHLHAGVWQRTGRAITPVLIFVAAAAYSRRIDLPRLAQKLVAQEFAAEFSEAFDQAMRTAR